MISSNEFKSFGLTQAAATKILGLIKKRPVFTTKHRVGPSINTQNKRAILLLIAILYRLGRGSIKHMALENNLTPRTVRYFVKKTFDVENYFYFTLNGEKQRPKRKKRKLNSRPTQPKKKYVVPTRFPYAVIPVGVPQAYRINIRIRLRPKIAAEPQLRLTE